MARFFSKLRRPKWEAVAAEMEEARWTPDQLLDWDYQWMLQQTAAARYSEIWESGRRALEDNGFDPHALILVEQNYEDCVFVLPDGSAAYCTILDEVEDWKLLDEDDAKSTATEQAKRLIKNGLRGRFNDDVVRFHKKYPAGNSPTRSLSGFPSPLKTTSEIDD